MKKLSSAFLALSLLMSSTVSASSVTGIRSVNDDFNLDYNSNIQSISDKFNVKSVIKETFLGDDSDQGISFPLDTVDSSLESQSELIWLLENDVVSREWSISVSGNNITVGGTPTLASMVGSGQTMNASDFLMSLYKSSYGIIESRPISFKVDSLRTAGKEYTYNHCEVVDGEEVCEQRIAYRDPPTHQNVMGGDRYKFTSQSGESIIGYFTEGDYYVYTTPNVKELYLKAAYLKGLLPIDDIEDKDLKSSLSGKETPSWDSSIPAFPMGYEDRNGLSKYGKLVGKPLGKSFDMTGVSDGSTQGSGDFVINYTPTSYLVDETLTSMEALGMVEKFLRLTEKDMTETEAEIVTYKYGVQYLSDFSEEDKKTLMFLTAKGILNFEDEAEYKNLYLDLNLDYALKILYRVANENGRLNFSEIQLTDSDNFWIQKGYSQNKLTIKSSEVTGEEALPGVQTQSVEKIDGSFLDVSTSPGSGGMLSATSIATLLSNLVADNSSTFDVVKVFENPEVYTFKGIKVSELKEGDPFIAKVDPKSGNYIVTFRVTASSGMNALQAIDSHLAFVRDTYYKSQSLLTVSKIIVNGEDITLVPATALEVLTYKGTKIEVLEDKVLRNSSTGATAVLLPDNDMALVGTHLIQSEDVMVTALNGEVYYNLAVIRTLLSNLYISELDNNSLYLTQGLVGEDIIEVRSDQTDGTLSKTFYASINAVAPNDDSGLYEYSEYQDFISLSHLGNGSNVLIKDFTVDDAQNNSVPFKIIVYFEFKLPNAEEGFTNPIYDSENPTNEEVHKFLYTAPTDEALYDVWWNNKEISNAIVNAMYGTNGTDYVKSGWIYPSIHILYDQNSSNQISLLRDFFTKAGNNISEEWYQRFTGRGSSVANKVIDGTGLWEDDVNGNSIYYPKKSITAGMFPLWVHAMFNNTLKVDSVPVHQQGSSSKKNTELWRSMMDGRILLYEASSVSRGTYKVYTLGSSVYVVTNGAQVYTMVDDTNDRMRIEEAIVTTATNFTKKKVLFLNTRTEDSSLESWKGRVVKYGESSMSFYIQSTLANSLRLVEMSRISGYPSFGDGFPEITGSLINYPSGNSGPVRTDAINTRYESIKSLFADSSLQGYAGTLGNFKKSGFLGNIGNLTEYPVMAYGIPLAEHTELSNMFLTESGDLTSYRTLGKVPINAYVGVSLSQNYWTITDAGELHPRKTYPFLNTGFIYKNSIAKNVIDSTIANYTGIKPVNDLPQGTKLIVGDITFIKSADGFISDPIKITSSNSVLSKPTDSSKVKSWITRLLGSININISNTVNAPLINYMTVNGLAEPTLNLSIKSGVLGLEKGVASVFKTTNGELTSTKFSSKSVVSHAIVDIKLDSLLLARPLLSSDSYELLFYTSEFQEGSVKNLPFFDEDLSLGDRAFDMLSGEQNLLKPVPNASFLKGKFLSRMDELFSQGILGWVKLTFTFILAFLAVYSWIIFAYTRTGLITNFMHALSKNARKEKDFDIMKKLTFGIYDLDNPMQFKTLVVFNFCCFLLMTLVWFWS